MAVQYGVLEDAIPIKRKPENTQERVQGLNFLDKICQHLERVKYLT